MEDIEENQEDGFREKEMPVSITGVKGKISNTADALIQLVPGTRYDTALKMVENYQFLPQISFANPIFLAIAIYYINKRNIGLSRPSIETFQYDINGQSFVDVVKPWLSIFFPSFRQITTEYYASVLRYVIALINFHSVL